MDKAIYECAKCHYPRQYGTTYPPDRKAKVVIACFMCGKVMPHEFIGIDDEVRVTTAQ